MGTYRIHWTQSGFTEVDADSSAQAREVFNAMTSVEARDFGDSTALEVYQVEEATS